eukprot:15441218-Alexandrium_andersonii.AAC.1
MSAMAKSQQQLYACRHLDVNTFKCSTLLDLCTSCTHMAQALVPVALSKQDCVAAVLYDRHAHT